MSFNITPKTVEIKTLKSLILFTGYNVKVKQTMPKGLKTAKDICIDTGAVLIPKEVVLEHAHIGQLTKRKENNPDSDFEFSLQSNDAMLDLLKDRLKSDFKRIVESKKMRIEYRRMMDRVQGVIEGYFDDIFKNEELVYQIYRLFFIEKELVGEGVTQQYYHMISVFIYSIGIGIQSFQVSDKKFTKEDFIKLGTIALLHDFAGMEAMPDSVEKTIEVRKQNYFKANSKSPELTATFVKAPEVKESLKNINDFHTGKNEFMKVEKMSTSYSNVVIIADLFDLMTNGMFDPAMGPKEVTDQLYVRATNKEVSRIYVDCMARGLKFDDLFDFYYELDKLVKWCPFEESSKPYPMTGFMSPTIVVCSKKINKCKEFQGATESINIIRPTSGLQEGSYGRCEKLSKDLVVYYEEFYKQIKEEVQTRATSEPEQK